MLSPAQVREQVATVRNHVAAPFALNFFCHVMPGQSDDGEWRALLQTYYDEFAVDPGNGGALRLPFDEAMCAPRGGASARSSQFSLRASGGRAARSGQDAWASS